MRAAPRRRTRSISTSSSARRRRSTSAATSPTDPEWVKTLTPGWQKRRMDNFNILVSGGWPGRGPGQRRLDRHHPQPRRDYCREGEAEAERMSPRRAGADDGAGRFQEDESGPRARRRIVKDKKTAEALKPWYRQFCKRPTFNDEYLPTFNRPNVTLVDTMGAASIASPRRDSCSTASSTRWIASSSRPASRSAPPTRGAPASRSMAAAARRSPIIGRTGLQHPARLL